MNVDTVPLIYFNSINITSASATQGAALYLDGLTTANNEFLNNNFVNSGNGYACYVTSFTNTPIASSNYNNFYSTSTNLAYWKSTGVISNLSTWQSTTSFDNNSVSYDPLYASSTDLHANSANIN